MEWPQRWAGEESRRCGWRRSQARGSLEGGGLPCRGAERFEAQVVAPDACQDRGSFTTPWNLR